MNEKIIAGFGIGLGILGIGYGIHMGNNMKKIAERVGLSIEALSHAGNMEIEDSMIERAVQTAVDREAGKAVAAAVKSVVVDTQAEIRRDVTAGVKQVYPELKSALTKELSRQIGEVDISEIRSEALEQAKEAAAEKLNASMDGILDKFNSELRNVSKIYNSILSMMSGEHSKEMTLRIG